MDVYGQTARKWIQVASHTVLDPWRLEADVDAADCKPQFVNKY